MDSVQSIDETNTSRHSDMRLSLDEKVALDRVSDGQANTRHKHFKRLGLVRR